MPFTPEQIQRGAQYALAAYQREARARPAADAPRHAGEVAALLRSQYVGFGLMVAIVCAAVYAAGQWVGAWP